MNSSDDPIHQLPPDGDQSLTPSVGTAGSGELASRRRRLVGWLIDSVMLLLIDRFLFSGGFAMNAEVSLAAVSDALLGSLLVTFVYYLPLEALHGRTVGKYVVGIEVVSSEGGKANWLAIAVRTICRFIPFEALTIFFSSQRRCLHDMLGGTLVVKR